MSEQNQPESTESTTEGGPVVETGPVENMNVGIGEPSQVDHGRRVVERAEETPTS